MGHAQGDKLWDAVPSEGADEMQEEPYIRGDSFGELDWSRAGAGEKEHKRQLKVNTKRRTMVVASGPCAALRMRSEPFYELDASTREGLLPAMAICGVTQSKRHLLSSLPLLAELNPDDKWRLAKLCTSGSAQPGESIASRESSADAFICVRKGALVATRGSTQMARLQAPCHLWLEGFVEEGLYTVELCVADDTPLEYETIQLTQLTKLSAEGQAALAPHCEALGYANLARTLGLGHQGLYTDRQGVDFGQQSLKEKVLASTERGWCIDDPAGIEDSEM